AQVELLHLESEYGYYYDEDQGTERYSHYVHAVQEGRRDVQIKDGKLTFEVTPGEATVGYMIRIKAGKTVTELVLDGTYPYDYYYRGGDNAVDATPRPALPTVLQLDVA